MEKKILVIDDEQPTLNMFRLLLAAYGYETLTAANGAEGVETFGREKPGIVLTDIKMPVMDGIEVLRRIKDIDPFAEVIVITGHGDMDLAIRALNLDATDFINKPVQRQALSEALSRAEERIALAKSQAVELAVEEEDDAAVLRIQGSVTARSEPLLDRAMARARECGKPRIVLRFSENASTNGAGLSLLTRILMECRERGESVCIEGLSENFRKVFEMVGISRLVEHCVGKQQ
ncbi:anti-anti-sigma factor [Humidesulfovibrio mexicanus]|uniref:Anti-anti-sigma factor n=1 Tax=Humidesulfovibrio mexicanus TaxID=147047 RepID=A0A238Z0A6_9BACT|nr:response regulator [Humidesulfovibrio mexicanus]SNR76358.1 anti-anti-sigma factor [Humidesulfovibrio mexicanus]